MTTPDPDRPVLPPTMPSIDPVRTAEGIAMSLSRIQAAMAHMSDVLDALPQWEPAPLQRPDPRQGDEVYVYDLLPGARVYVLEDVFTVDRVDMEAPLPTVWLKELPTSPLYFTEDESIYLADEPDQS